MLRTPLPPPPEFAISHKRTADDWIRDFQKNFFPWFDALQMLVTNDVQCSPKATTIASAATLKISAPIHHVSGVSAISNITGMPKNFTGPVWLIPDGAWTLVTGGNIARAANASVNRVMLVVFDGVNWYPGYTGGEVGSP